MAKEVREFSVRDIGYAGVIKHIVSDFLKKETGLSVLVEPQPVMPAEPHLRIMFSGFEFVSEFSEFSEFVEDADFTGYGLENVYTLKMECLLTLTAQGDGPDVFLDEVISACFKVQKLFHKPITISVVDGFGITVSAKVKDKGQLFKNEEEGKKPYLFEKNFELAIYMPYVEVKHAP
jgi:hypothetical protein